MPAARVQARLSQRRVDSKDGAAARLFFAPECDETLRVDVNWVTAEM